MGKKLSVLIAGGSGTIGTALTQELRSAGHDVYLLSRNPSAHNLYNNAFAWDPSNNKLDFDEIIKETGKIDVVVNLAGETISKLPWTKKTKQGILNSRIQATRTLVTAIQKSAHKPQALINGSAVGIYGSRGNELLNEKSTPGVGFLSDVVVAWEKEASVLEKNVRLAYARTGLVLAQQGALKPLRLITSLFISGPLAGGKDWWPWISLKDEARALAFLVENKVSGPVNLVAPTPETSGVIMKTLAKLMKRPYWLPVPRFAISLLLGEAGKELLLSSQKISPEVLLSSGFTFENTDLSSALHSALRYLVLWA